MVLSVSISCVNLMLPVGSMLLRCVYHLHVTVYCLIHLQYCDSSPEEASSCVGENVTRNVFCDCLCYNQYVSMNDSPDK